MKASQTIDFDDSLRSDILIENVAAIARLEPERIFAKLLFRNKAPVTITYGRLLTEGGRYATLYKEKGVPPGSVVVIILDHGEEILYAFVGALLYGAVPSIFAQPSVKIAPDEYSRTISRLLDVCDTRFLVTGRDIASQLPPDAARRDGLRLIFSDEYETRRATLDLPPSDPQAIILLQHSSGTTGLKKGVALSNRSIINQLRNYVLTLALNSSDKIASWLPLYHDMGLIACFVLPMACRIPLVLMSPFEWVSRPVLLFDAIQVERCTLSWMPNFAYNFLASRLTDEDITGIDLASMRAFINCAEPISFRSHELFYEKFKSIGVRREMLCTCYAMAENTFAVTQGGIREPVAADVIDPKALREEQRAVPADERTVARDTIVSSGTAIPNNEIRIFGVGRRGLPERSVGEIAIRSDSILTEYYRRPELTAEAVRDGWYFTGDLGYLAEGNLFVIGRIKDTIIVAGKNLYPHDIEEIASAVPGIHPGRVVAFGVYNEAIGTEEVIILAETEVSDPKRQLPIKLAVAKAIREQLECIANEIVLLPPLWLIKSSSGKISRPGNREKYLRELVQSNGMVQKAEA
ncbi:MAG TPA: AMP-binding protein [Candidatus Binatia bacterium]|jgi:acyl-CoA synthetase (AMP-forming)/AMP-acid ligase II